MVARRSGIGKGPPGFAPRHHLCRHHHASGGEHGHSQVGIILHVHHVCCRMAGLHQGQRSRLGPEDLNLSSVHQT